MYMVEGIPYKSCPINKMGLKLHIVNEKLEEIHHGIVSITESIPANEYNLYLHINRSTSFCAIGVFISGFIQMFVTEDMVAKWMPKTDFCLF